MKPYEKLKLVWCPEVRRLSFVETDAISEGGGASGFSQALSLVART